MKNLIFAICVFSFASFAKADTVNEVALDACFDQAIEDLETFEYYNGAVDNETATAILNEAYAICDNAN